jgi:predicted porin
MKKSLLALAVLGAFAGMASAQSSVTLFGIVDVNLKHVKNGAVKQNQMSQDGINSSRLGFRGVEDLGGGLSASFWIEGALNPDTGTPGGQNWQRRSTASLSGGFGEVRLGRDYTATFVNVTSFDPFGTNGVGSWTNIAINNNGVGNAGVATSSVLGTNSGTYVRSNNMVGYFLPSGLGGFYGMAQVSAQEAAAPNGNKYQGARLGYAAGPVNVGVAYGKTETGTPDLKAMSVGASYNLGFARLMASYEQLKASPRKHTTYLIGAVVPLGQGELKLAFDKANEAGGTAAQNERDADMIAVGYVYNLSKRTALYGQYARINNKGGADGASYQVSAINGSAGTTPGTKSQGVEFGMRHSF